MIDLMIIGAGPGGYELALEAAHKGLTVRIIEKEKTGGVCLHEGCIPTKTLYATSELIKQLKRATDMGFNDLQYTFDFQKVRERKHQVVEQLHSQIEFALQKAGIERITGHARFVNDTTVEVQGLLYQAKHIVIATGSSPIMISGFEKALTSKGLLDIDHVPQRLMVIGGGVIGIELATIFHYFGSEVIIVEAMDSILPLADKEIARRLNALLKQQGIQILTSCKAVSYVDGVVQIEGKTVNQSFEVDEVLMAIGRRPNIHDLGLEHTSIQVDKKIIVNDQYQTTVPHIYAIGDVVGHAMLAHYATYSGYRVLNHILNVPDEIDFRVVPSCVFTFPEVSWVGFTEEICKNEQINYRIFKGLYRANGKACAMNETDGFVKVIVSDNVIIGAHIIGKDASVLIHELSGLMRERISVDRFLDWIHSHPTLSELLHTTFK